MALDKAVLDSQHSFFEQHPFPGLDFSDLKSPQQFIYTLEKNFLYKAIKKLLKPGQRLMDAGCGTGEFTTYLSLFSGAEVVGVDYSANTVQWANGVKERFSNHSKVSFVAADIFQLLPKDLGQFDFVLAMGLFPSIPNEKLAMKSLTGLVNPGGVVIFGFFDPVARAYIRLKRFLIQRVSRRFGSQKAICRDVLLRHVNDENEIIWHLNQLTEEFLNYHSPLRANSMMREAGLTVTDCYPRFKIKGEILPDALNIHEPYRFPTLQIFRQLNWLKSKTDGYFVLVGKKD